MNFKLKHKASPDLQFIPDPGMNTGVGHKSLLERQREKGPVRNLGLFGNASPQNRCWPGVDVCIEVDDRDGPINLVKRSKNGKHLGMVRHVNLGVYKGMRLCISRWYGLRLTVPNQWIVSATWTVAYLMLEYEDVPFHPSQASRCVHERFHSPVVTRV